MSQNWNMVDRQLLDYEHERLEKIASEVGALLSDQETVDALRESIRNIASQIIKVYSENPNTNFIFVVGGKSRRLTEMMLSRVQESLPSGHPAIKAIKDRIRLDDQQNKNLYGERTSTQQGNEKRNVPALMKFFRNDAQFIICDDNMETGRKVFHTLDELSKAGISARYLLFSGPVRFSPGSDYHRPKNWEQFQSKVFVGTRNEKVATAVRGLSDFLSSYANVRLNRNVNAFEQGVPATIDDLSKDQAQTLRMSSKLMAKLKSLL